MCSQIASRGSADSMFRPARGGDGLIGATRMTPLCAKVLGPAMRTCRRSASGDPRLQVGEPLHPAALVGVLVTAARRIPHPEAARRATDARSPELLERLGEG